MIFNKTIDNLYLPHIGRDVYRAPLSLVDLPSDIKLFLVYDNGRVYQYQLEWEATAANVLFGRSGELKVQGNGQQICAFRLSAGSFPPAPRGSISRDHPASRDSLYLTVSITLELELGEQRDAQPTLPPILSTLLCSAQPNDVRFDFPRVGESLWANEAVLTAIVPHLSTALGSSFSEGSASTDPPATKSSLPAYSFEESDDEGDEIDEVEEVKSSTYENEDTPVCPVKVVVVTDVAYRTYWAVLYWIHSRDIAFAPLPSTFRIDGQSREEAAPLRSAALSSARTTTTSLSPGPVSPESLKWQLRPDTVAYELYAEVTFLHPEIHDVVLDFVVKNWDSVDEAAATEEMEQKAEREELEPGSAATAMRLAKRLAKRTA